MYIFLMLCFYESFKNVLSEPSFNNDYNSWSASKYYLGLCGTLKRPCGWSPAKVAEEPWNSDNVFRYTTDKKLC
jgi:hypothetical protein